MSVCGENGMGEADNAGVIVRPPVLYAAALVAVLVLRWLWPLPILPRGGLWPGLALVALGVGILIWGRRTLLVGGTNVDRRSRPRPSSRPARTACLAIHSTWGWPSCISASR